MALLHSSIRSSGAIAKLMIEYYLENSNYVIIQQRKEYYKMSKKGRAKKVERFISPHITEVHDAYGMGGELKYQEPVSHDTVVVIAAILASHEELLAEQQKGLAALEKKTQKAFDDLCKLLSKQADKYHLEQTDLLKQILQNQSGR